MNTIFAYISFLIIIAVTIPYMVDIVRGRAQPARAARIMFFLLMIITLAQQHTLGSGYAMAVTIAELVSAVMLLVLSIRYGVGGLSKSDTICYVFLAASLGVWVLTNNALLALHISIVADTVAFWPTLEKTWRDPKSETPLFFWGGVVAPLFSILAEGSLEYSLIVFPLYLSLANLLELGLIYSAKHRHTG
jgi:hypothetical protein